MRRALKFLLLAAGLGLFALFVHKAGVGEISRGVARLGGFAPLVLLPYGFVYVCDTFGWYLAFGALHPARPSFLTFLRVRWSGESVNNVVPSAYIGGEALKAYLLTKRGVPMVPAAASVVASKTCQVLAQVVFIALGAALAWRLLPAGSPGRFAMIATTALALAIVGGLFWLQRRGLFRGVELLLRRLRLRVTAFERNRERLRALDERVFAFYHKDKGRFAASTLAYLGGWMADSIEVYLVCFILGHPITWPEALAMEAFIGVAKAVGIFVPGALGVQESGVVLLFQLFGLPPPLGVAYAIIRRGRELVYAAVGILLLYMEEASFQTVFRRARETAAITN